MMTTTRRFVRRRLAASPAKRLAGRGIGAALALRDRRLAVAERWERALPFEVEFWDDWLANGHAVDRLDPDSVVSSPLFVAALEALPVEEVSILDVGAGPLTALEKTYPGKRLEITAIDPLADEYDRLLARHRIVPPVRTRALRGEDIASAFAPRSFHIACSANALDHTYDPVRVIRNMLDVVVDDGVVLLVHHLNEGRSTGYLKLHQWNLEDRDGDLYVWNREGATNVTALLGPATTVECRRSWDAGLRRAILECRIARRPAGAAA